MSKQSIRFAHYVRNLQAITINTNQWLGQILEGISIGSLVCEVSLPLS